MAVTFETLIEHNKRTSLALISLLILLITAAGVTLTFAINIDRTPSPETIVQGGLLAFSFALLISCFSFYFGAGTIAAICGARKIEDFEDRELFNVVEEMAIAAGTPTPAVYVVFDPSPNAFASGRDPKHSYIGITTGLRTKLNRDELQAVIAHEMGHIINYDTRLMMLIAVAAGIVVLMSDTALRMVVDQLKLKPFQQKRDVARAKAVPIFTVALFVVIIFAWIAPLLAKILQLAVSREREYLADATAVKLCRNPEALVSALKKIALDSEVLEHQNRALEHLYIVNPNPLRRMDHSNDDSVWLTHPPLVKRISRLAKIAGMEMPTEAGKVTGDVSEG